MSKVAIEDMSNEEYKIYLKENNIKENWEHRFIRRHPLIWKAEKSLLDFTWFVIKVKIALIIIFKLAIRS